MAGQTAPPVIATVTGMDEYHQRILRAAHSVLSSHGIPLVSHLDGPYERGAGSPLLVSLLKRASPRGVITMNQIREDDQRQVFDLLAELEVPVVHVGVEAPGATSVRGDNETGMGELMAHLLDERDVVRPVLIRGSAHQPDSDAREQVFRDAMASRGLEVDEELVLTGEFNRQATYPAMQALLDRRQDMDAVVALNDPMASAAMSALEHAGLRVPEDVLVTGFDNDEVATYWPGLTTVDQQLELQGETAAHLLLELIEGGEPRQVVVPSHMVERGSTAPRGQAAVRDVATAVEMAQRAQGQLATQAAVLAMRRSLDYCWTVEQAVNSLGDHLRRLGVTRCFLALHERPEDAPRGHGPGSETTGKPGTPSDRARLVLDYRDGQLHYPDATSFPPHRLVPPSLATELHEGKFILQPLSVLDRSIGYVLFEQAPNSGRITELMRTDLSHAIDGVLTTQENQNRAETLERIVEQRTTELRTEIMTRQRAEHRLQQANVELRRSAMLDGLTQIANRAAFEECLNTHWDLQAVEGGTIAMIMADVDEFKAYNDHYGHVLGDDALRTIATCLDRSVRNAQDLACRFGGEEFAVVLPRSDVAGALAVAKRFRELLAGVGIPHAASGVGDTVTVSIGIATATPIPGTHPNDVVGAADRALYRAKDLGRDQIAVDAASHETTEPTPVVDISKPRERPIL